MKTLASLSLLALSALALQSCTCPSTGGSGVSLKNGGCGSKFGNSAPVTAQGGTGPRHIGLVPTMEVLAE